MNKDRRNFLMLTQFCSIFLLTSLVADSAQAQNRAASTATDSRGEANRAVALSSRFRMALAPFGLRVMPAANTSISTGAGLFAPMAAPGFPVFGAGTLGRITKWTDPGRALYNGAAAWLDRSNRELAKLQVAAGYPPPHLIVLHARRAERRSGQDFV